MNYQLIMLGYFLMYILYNIKNIKSENSDFDNDLFLKKSWKIINDYDTTYLLILFFFTIIY